MPVQEMQERLGLDDRSSPWWGEHRSRYRFALAQVRHGLVLDVACGSGHGLQLLTEGGARSVVGVEIDADAVRTARCALPDSVTLVRADGTALPMVDGSVDVLTSFETIEHIGDDTAFVAEIRRVLAPDGIAIVSTPNARVTRPVAGVPRNPFHVREYTCEEFATLLGRAFGAVEVVGQVTSQEFGTCPYWQLDQDLPSDAAARMRVLLWKLGVRLPTRARNAAFHLATGHGPYPGEHDFAFDPAATERAHVQVAVCRP